MYRLKEKITKILKSPALSDLWRWSKLCRLPLLGICLLNLMIAGATLGIPMATRGLIDGAAEHNRAQIIQYAVVLALMVLLIRGISLVQGFLHTKTNALLQKELRGMLLKRLLSKQYAGLDGYHSGELVNRMFSDVNVVKNGIMEIVPGLVSMGASFVGAFVILILMDWRFAAVLVLGAILGLFLMVLFRNPMKKRHKAVQETEGKLHAVLQETLENLRVVKASGSEARMERQAERCQQRFVKAQTEKGYFSVYMNSAVNTVFHLSWLFCMLWGCLGIYRENMTYGMLAAMIQLVGQIQMPVVRAANIAGQFYSMIGSAERLKELMDLPEEAECDAVNGKELYHRLTEIRLQELSFSYERETEDVLRDVNIGIRPGDFVAVTGISGEGKSTLFQLLLGIYPPSAGSVQFIFHDPDQKENASHQTRALFAYVPQGNTLFSGTLRENFSMFADAATDEEIMAAAKLSCIDQLIEELKDGLDTVIGERGIGLSEGQAQRVAIARALLSKAPILLLDESTSALDEETEARLLHNISLMQDKTCLIVTHRKAAMKICDYGIHIAHAKVCRYDIGAASSLETVL